MGIIKKIEEFDIIKLMYRLLLILGIMYLLIGITGVVIYRDNHPQYMEQSLEMASMGLLHIFLYSLVKTVKEKLDTKDKIIKAYEIIDENQKQIIKLQEEQLEIKDSIRADLEHIRKELETILGTTESKYLSSNAELINELRSELTKHEITSEVADRLQRLEQLEAECLNEISDK